MKSGMILATVLVLVIGMSGCVTYFPDTGTAEEQACEDSGGTVTTGLCCGSVGDFPNTCLVGPCGCAPANSHEVKVCDCGEGKCFDGDGCMEITGPGDEVTCLAPTGESMSLAEAKEIASASECVENGTLKDTSQCNADTGTWWIDLDIEKEGCSPACVVDIAEGMAEINWRCTGLLT